jgi:hypothetical protein
MEQAIRPFTMGRKNWLFAGSPRGASASAFIYSLIESAKANGLEPKRYLNELFERYSLSAIHWQSPMNCVLPYCSGILNLANSQVGENPVVGRTLTPCLY